MDIKKRLMLVTQPMFYLDYKNIIILKVLNLHAVTNGKSFLRKNLNLNKKLCPLNIYLKRIEKKDYPY